MKKITGIIPPMITPFTADGAVDRDAFTYNVTKWSNTGMSGLLVLGSNSETAFLTEEEKLELIRITVANANGKLVLAGTGMETADATIRLTNKASDLGADCALLLPPNYYSGAMNAAALGEYYTTVADAAKIPILLYNVPKYTHVTMTTDLIAQLAKHPNIIGMKDSTGDMPQFSDYAYASRGEDYCMLVGTAGALFPALALDADGGILAIANCVPEECLQVYDLYRAGDWKASRELYQRLYAVNTALTATYGIAGLKAACGMLGYKGGSVRKPLQELTPEKKEEVKAILTTAGVLEG